MSKENINDIKHTKKLVSEEEHKRDRTNRGRAIRKRILGKGDFNKFSVAELFSEMIP